MSRIQEIDFSVNLLQALLWQYNDAEKLQSLLQKKQDFINTSHSEFWQNWITDVFDIKTANDFGLSVWSIILDLPIYAGIQTKPQTQSVFGFGGYRQNFGRGNFGSVTGGLATLPIAIKRIALRLRYYQLIGTCTVPAINRMLADVFADYGKVYLLDALNMTQAYAFTFKPDAYLEYMLSNLDVLPRPAGVESSRITAGITPFGFGDYRQNFDNGNYYRG